MTANLIKQDLGHSFPNSVLIDFSGRADGFRSLSSCILKTVYLLCFIFLLFDEQHGWKRNPWFTLYLLLEFKKMKSHSCLDFYGLKRQVPL